MKTELFQLQPEEYPMLALCVSRSPSNETFLKKILFPLDPEHYLALPPLYGQFNAHGHCYNNSVKNAPLLQATLMTCDLSTCLCLSEAIFFIFWPIFCTCNWKPFEWASEMHMTPKPNYLHVSRVDICSDDARVTMSCDLGRIWKWKHHNSWSTDMVTVGCQSRFAVADMRDSHCSQRGEGRSRYGRPLSDLWGAG